MVNTEILAQAMAFGMRIHEVKVSHYPRRYGKPSGANLRVIAKAFRELFRLWGQLRNTTHEQAGLFVEKSLTDDIVLGPREVRESVRGGTSFAHRLTPEPARQAAQTSGQCFAD
jgi:hypothetical protein